ncbi:MAG: hypothetical protein ACLP9S_11895 [Syntrophales bacterium]|jgi:hypothetical protein
MRVLIYSTKMDGAGERTLRLIETVASKSNINIYRTIGALSNGLRQPRTDMIIALLFASSKDDLIDLLSIRDLLWDIRTILVLPDSEPDTVAKGHMLRPRFLSYCESDLLIDIAPVLSLMIRNLGANPNVNLHK